MHRIGRGCWKDRARRAVRHAGVGTAGVAGLALLAGCGSFLGLDETGSGGFAPPDPVIAVSKDYVVETVNRRTRIWKRDTPTTLVADFDTSGQFFALGNTCSGNGFSDPRVRFDFSSRRWFLAATETGTPGRWCLAVSQSENPTAGWFFYAFQPPPAWFGPEIGYQPVFPDYPGLGVGERTVTLTGNLAHGFFGLAQVEQSAILVVNKADLEHGANPHAAYFAPPNATTDGPLFLLQPANNYGGFQPGWESVTAGVNVLADPGRFLRLQVVTGVPTDGVIPFLTKVGIAVAANKPFRQPPDARQPGPGTIAANDERVLDVQARAGFLWVALHQGCEPPGDVDGVGNPIRRVCARYLEIDPTTFVLRQDFKVIAPKRYFYYPALALDSAGNLLTAFDASSETEYPSVYLTGRAAADPPNTLHGLYQVRAGSAGYRDSRHRWGDYSGGAPEDPLAGQGAWFSTEFPLDAVHWATYNGTIHANEYR